jgi:hypothetical protein
MRATTKGGSNSTLVVGWIKGLFSKIKLADTWKASWLKLKYLVKLAFKLVNKYKIT